MKKRIGNDIQFTWHIFRKSGETQTPESFEGKEVEVKLISPLKQPVTIEDVTIATGVVTFTFKGKHQVTLGNYVAVLQENKGENGMVTLDVVDAVTLVPHSYMEEDGDEGDVIEAEAVELESEIEQGFVQQQADWAQTDDTAVDYIKNKPNLDVYCRKDADNTHSDSSDTYVKRVYYEQGALRQLDRLTVSGDSIKFYHSHRGEETKELLLQLDDVEKIKRTATTELDGLMSAEDKGKLNDLPTDAELTQELAGKQDTINDLAAIRNGAQAGATAYQKPQTGIPATDLASDVQTDLAAIDGIEAVIPGQASPSNKLVDEDSMNSAIATATATYRGSYNIVSDLLLSVSATQQQIADALASKMAALSITPDNNDYCFVQIPTADATPTEIARIDRYKYDGTAWAYEYSLNNSSFTAAQWAALNSGITSGLVSKLSDLPTATELATLLAGKANSADLAEVATSGSYNDLSDKPDLSGFITKSVDNLINYYLKSETYTKAEVQQLIGAIQQFHYEVYPTLPQTGASNVLYLIGPTGTGTDKYEEYVYANNDWTKIGDTSIDLSGYVTTQALNTALADYVTSSALSTALANYYNKTEVDGLFAGKENVMPITTATGATLSAVVGNYYRLDNVGTLAITLPTITGATKLQAITFLLVCGSSALVTFAPQGSETILYQEGFALEADTTYEVTALWNGSEWTLSRVIYE